jgi:hypothetical protein
MYLAPPYWHDRLLPAIEPEPEEERTVRPERPERACRRCGDSLAPDEGPVLCVGCQRYCLAVCETLDPGPIEEADY